MTRFQYPFMRATTTLPLVCLLCLPFCGCQSQQPSAPTGLAVSIDNSAPPEATKSTGPDVSATSTASGTSNITNDASRSAATATLAAATGNSSVLLKWAAAEDSGVTYNVYRSNMPGAEPTDPVATGLPAPSYRDNSVHNGSAYYYELTTVRNKIESARSAELRIQLAAKPPTIVIPASANPNPVTHTVSTLSVLGADVSGESNLTYTWSLQGSQHEFVLFRENGTNQTKSCQILVPKAGAYKCMVTIKNRDGNFVTSSVTVISKASQSIAHITVFPSNISLKPGQTQAFGAWPADQFGSTYLSPFPKYKWKVISGTGKITSAGVFTAPPSSETDTVQATYGSLTSTTTISTGSESSIPLPTVSNLVATPSDGQISLNWMQDQSRSWFNVYRSTSPGSEGLKPYQSHVTTVEFDDTKVVNGQTYYYQMSAENSNAGEGPRSSETAAMAGVPVTHLTPALAIAAARTFCAAIGNSVPSNDPGNAHLLSPGEDSYLSTSYKGTCWRVNFGNGNIKVAVDDATGIIPFYMDRTTINENGALLPDSSRITEALARQSFAKAVAASKQTDSLGTVKIRYISSPRNGNIYDMAAPRLAQGYPLQNDAALLILQSGTGKVQSFILFYTCSLPPHEVVSVSQSTAVSAANKVIASDKLQGFKIGTPQQHWVQFRQPGTYSGTPPFRLAWDIPYSDGHRTANVMIDSATGLTLINSVGPTRFPPP